MSPARLSSSRKNSSGSSKPYNRDGTPLASPIPDGTPNLKTPGGAASPSVGIEPVTPLGLGHWTANDSTISNERPGFPTYAQYKQVETSYIQSLTPRRQGKALISQSLFDRIWDVLHEPEVLVQGETAQFRFWARKMFKISSDHHVTLGGVEPTSDDAPKEVLLHDNLLVAVQEQLYDLLCYCHGSTGHGGRDKTCALIRKHYTWVPKDLVASFIKTCPTCIMKKCGGFDSAAIASQVSGRRTGDSNTSPRDSYERNDLGSESPLLSRQTLVLSGAPVPWPSVDSPEGSATSPLLSDDPLEVAYRDAMFHPRGMKPALSGIRGLQGLPMSREVSLYKGLPNGWQYRHNDYATAHAEFMKTRSETVVDPGDLGISALRPRVPSIAPLWGPDQFPQDEFDSLLDGGLDDSIDLQPALEPRSLLLSGLHHEVQDDPFQLYTNEPLQEKDKESHSFVPQIDPSLLDLSVSSDSQAEDDISDENASLLRPTNEPASPSLRRPAPPRLNLDLANEKAMRALMAYRDNVSNGNSTPDSPITNINWEKHTHHPGHPSPASSDSGSSCELSPFSAPMSTMTSASGTSSALPTPVDECGSNGEGKMMSMIKGKQRMMAPAVDAELSEGIQLACAL